MVSVRNANATADTVWIEIDAEIAERIAQLAWERNISEQRVLQLCCLHGLLNYEEALMDC
jgi:hypothetical protein